MPSRLARKKHAGLVENLGGRVAGIKPTRHNAKLIFFVRCTILLEFQLRVSVGRNTDFARCRDGRMESSCQRRRSLSRLPGGGGTALSSTLSWTTSQPLARKSSPTFPRSSGRLFRVESHDDSRSRSGVSNINRLYSPLRPDGGMNRVKMTVSRIDGCRPSSLCG